MKRFKVLFLFLFLLIMGNFPFFLKAQPSENFNFNPGRPGFTTGSNPLILHTLSVETSFTFMVKNKNNWSWSNFNSLRYSPISRLELNLGVGYAQKHENIRDRKEYNTIKSMTPLSIGAKVNVLRKNQKGKPGIALYASLALPIGIHSQDLVEECTGVWGAPTLGFFMDHNFEDRFGLSYNLLATWYTQSSNLMDLNYSINGNYNISDRMSVYIEFIGTSSLFSSMNIENLELHYSKEHLFNMHWNAGFSAYITKALQFDLSVGVLVGEWWEGKKEKDGSSFWTEIGLSYGIPLRKAS